MTSAGCLSALPPPSALQLRTVPPSSSTKQVRNRDQVAPPTNSGLEASGSTSVKKTSDHFEK